MGTRTLGDGARSCGARWGLEQWEMGPDQVVGGGTRTLGDGPDQVVGGGD